MCIVLRCIFVGTTRVFLIVALLSRARWNKSPEVMRLLLDAAGDKINEKSAKGNTALMIAAR